MKITVASRSSPLAKAQVREVFEELKTHYPEIEFECLFLETTGDRDRKTSLRDLDKTDFFTREIDRLQQEGTCRVAIHSAKDLPEPLPPGIVVAAITKGVDSSDSLVMREGEDLAPGAVVATSSVRREEAVRCLKNDVVFVDLRGTIEERLNKLLTGEVDGVVVAEAALIRLGLTHLNRVTLPGLTVPFQGQLAVTVQEQDEEMKTLLSVLQA